MRQPWNEGFFIIILVLNTLVSAAYLLFQLVKKEDKNKSCWFKAFVMFMCPVAGPCFFLLAYIFLLTFFHKEVDLADVIFSKERVRTFLHAEEDRERNMVPLEEAIEITDTDSLRTLMMNVVRGDIHQSLASISLALNSEDTEVAHYAASVLQDALNDFRINVQKQQNIIMQEDDNQAVYAGMTIDYINQVLEQHVFSELEQKNYVGIMDEICDILYEKDPVRMTAAQYEAICLRLLEIEEYERCREWCERSKEQYPNTLSTYTCQLKLYFNSGQKEKFFEVIEDLKHSAVVVDSETLELIRVFR